MRSKDSLVLRILSSSARSDEGMKLVTRRAKFKLDQGQEAVEREGVRDCFPSTLFVCSVLSEIKQNNAFRNPDKKCSKKFFFKTDTSHDHNILYR